MPEATNDVVWAWIGTGSPWTLLWLWLALINLVTFLVFGFDKLKAKYKEKHEGARRVPEKTLFLLAALGGSVGALLGMRVWRHKTLHQEFPHWNPADFGGADSDSGRAVALLECGPVSARKKGEV